jgi:L-lactate dehydrogenase complex protein LldF
LLSRLKRKKKVRRALKDVHLQKALDRASTLHNRKYLETSAAVPWEEYKKKAREIREKNVGRLPELIERFSREATKAGVTVHRASTPAEARETVLRIARDRSARLIVKSKSMVTEEIALNEFLERDGLEVVETDLGEWIIQLAGDRPSHITAPATHLTKEKVAEIISRKLGRTVPADIPEIVRTAREYLRQYFIRADIGISGANLAVAESGTLVIISNEGNARLVTTLPPVHIAVVTAEKFVETLEEATILVKTLTLASAGRRLTAYVSFITGPSGTSDVEKEHVVGAHGPREVHVVILDNGRLGLAENDDFKETLYCLKCGGCMLVCPVFQAVGGHVFGGPVYPGGIGTLMTAMTVSVAESGRTLAMCADCRKCQDFCPVGIPTGELLVKLKASRGSSLPEKGLSLAFGKRRAAEKGAGILGVLQKIWQKDGHFRALPLTLARGKRYPSLKYKRGGLDTGGQGKTIYFFQGCLVKYFFPEVRDSVVRSLTHFGYRVVIPADQACCGAPSLHLGDTKAVRDLAAANIASIERENPDYILTVCPTGHSMLKNDYPGIDDRAARWRDKVVDFTDFLASRDDLPRAAKERLRVYYHSPCHYVSELKLGDRPRQLLETIGCDLAKAGNPSTCCGFCGVFSVKNPEISAHLWDRKRREILESGAGIVATDCPGCLLQLRAGLKKADTPIRSRHTAELLAETLDSAGRDAKA